MANAYIFNAAIYCEECAVETMTGLGNDGVADDGDSDTYPQGPYSAGGGESDCPQHCEGCQLFLENPLTSEGRDYVAESIETFLADGSGARDIIAQWADFYGASVTVTYAWPWITEKRG